MTRWPVLSRGSSRLKTSWRQGLARESCLDKKECDEKHIHSGVLQSLRFNVRGKPPTHFATPRVDILTSWPDLNHTAR